MDRGSAGLAAQLRAATQHAHRRAERSGIMGRLVSGRIDRAEYAALLRNLHPVYAVLEPALTRLSTDPVIAPIYMPRIARLEALERDLVYWGGAQWRSLAIVPGAESYRVRLAALAVGDPALLVAHAYVRYLGDLSGGQILAGRVTALFGTIGQGVAFYGFGTEDVGALRERYRDGLDAIPLDQGARVRVIGEALEAFALHERMFMELG